LTIVSLVGHTDRGLLELLVAAVSDDSELRAEPFDVVCLAAQKRLRDRQREGGVRAPVGLIRSAITACSRCQIAYAHGRVTIVPRRGRFSASSVLAMTPGSSAGSPQIAASAHPARRDLYVSGTVVLATA
jgi:hypothetical protein